MATLRPPVTLFLALFFFGSVPICEVMAAPATRQTAAVEPSELDPSMAMADTTVINPCPPPCTHCIPPSCPLQLVAPATSDYCTSHAVAWSFADSTSHMTGTNTNGSLLSDVLPVPAGTGDIIASWDQYVDMPRGSGYVQLTEFRFFKNSSWSGWRNSSPSGTLRFGIDQTWTRVSDNLAEAAQTESIQIRYSIACVHSLSSASIDCNPVTYGVLYDNLALYEIAGVPPTPVFGIRPSLLPQSTFVNGTIAGTNCNPATVTAGACWPGIRGSDVGTAAAIHDNVNSPTGDSIVIAIVSPLRTNGMGVNWHFGYDKSVGGGLSIARTNASFHAAFDVPRIIYRLFDPASKTWSPFDSSALDADAVTVGVSDTTLNGNGFRMVWPPRDHAGSSLPGGFSVNGHTLYSQIAFLPRGTRLQYYFKAVDIQGNQVYQFTSDTPTHEVIDLPTLPGSSIVAPDILEFDVLPSVYSTAGSAGTLVAGKTNTPLLEIDGAHGVWSGGTDPIVQAFKMLGVRADRYRLLQGIDYGNDIGGHELTPPAFGPGTNYFPNMNEYAIKDSLAAWYRIFLLNGDLRTDQLVSESDAKLIHQWWDTSTGTDGGDRCVFASGNDLFNSLQNGGAGISGPEEGSLASTVLGVASSVSQWSGTISNTQPLMDDRFSGSGPGLGAPGSFKYPVENTCPVPKRFDALTKTSVGETQVSTLYPGTSEGAAITNMKENDVVADHDRVKALSYALSPEYIRQGGENLVDTRAQVLYRFLTSCRGSRSFADTDTCFPCPADASKYGNWAVLSGFQTGQYGPLYPIQNGNLAAAGVIAGAPPRANHLSQNRPNPFNPSTQIPYELSRSGHVSIVILDVQGRRVRALQNDFEVAGPHITSWDGFLQGGGRAPSGFYFYRVLFED